MYAGYFAPINTWAGAITMAIDTDNGRDPPPCGVGSPGRDGWSVWSSGTDPPRSFEGTRSFLRHSAMKLSLHLCNPSPQDLSSNSILPHESRTFDPNIAAHTVISNQNGSVTELSREGAFVSPKSIRQQ